ncbi:hypothetical protein NMY22_g15670 [Coprinellus aureogranulatus]|nr:hypothetical protein NMY22_g15670 [Coprinellus aureogranulatus]
MASPPPQDMYHPQPCIPIPLPAQATVRSPPTLDSDVLEVVFRFLLISGSQGPRWQLQRAKKNIKQLHTLQLVCYLWRATALRPTLWTLLLNLDLPHGQFKGVLKHTESAPLYIDYNNFDQPSDLNVRSSSANWTLALRNMTRIRSLRLCFAVPVQGMLDTKSLRSSFRQLSPQIVSFVITMPPVNGSTQIVRLPETFLDVPDSQLGHLSFFDCYLTPKKRLPDLTTLIFGYPNESMNSSEFIIPWLLFISKSGAPHLRSLMVHGNFVLQAANHQREAISLPITLSKLTLWCSIRTLRRTLSHITIPPRCTIMIGLTGPWFRDTPRLLFSPVSSLWGSLPSTEVTVVFSFSREGGHMLLKQVGKMREVVARPGAFSREDLESTNLANNGKGIYPIVDQHTWLCLYLRSYEPDNPQARRPEGEAFLPAMRKYISGFSTVQNIHIYTFEIVNWGLELRVIEPDEFKRTRTRFWDFGNSECQPRKKIMKTSTVGLSHWFGIDSSSIRAVFPFPASNTWNSSICTLR